GRLERRQRFLARIVDIGAELFAMSAACVRARAERRTHPEGVELADLFCRQARRRVDGLFRDLWRNTDARDVALARKVGTGAYTSLESGVITPPDEGDWVATWSSGASSAADQRRRVPRSPVTGSP